MARRTKKVGRTGRFGPRYGLSVRRRINAIEQAQFRDHRCPRCLTGRLKRTSTAIWACRKCAHKFAGGAYVPVASTVRREYGRRDEAPEGAPAPAAVPEAPDPVAENEVPEVEHPSIETESEREE